MFAAKSNKQITGISKAAAEKLLAYSWPGNIRELRNVVERAVALTQYDQISVDDLPEKIRTFKSTQFLIDIQDPTLLTSLEEVEHRYIEHVLKAVDDNKTKAAKILGLDRKTLYRKLKQIDES